MKIYAVERGGKKERQAACSEDGDEEEECRIL